MAKTQKYDDQLLTDAVIRYAEQHKGKIKCTELAVWARRNVPGLEEVRDYHFSRPETVINMRSGEKECIQKRCTAKIHELNIGRSNTAAMENNLLLCSSCLDDFFALPRHKQRQLILDTRAQMETMKNELQATKIKNEKLCAENSFLRNKDLLAKDSLNAIVEKQSGLEKVMSAIKKYVDRETRERALASIGIKDGKEYDLNVLRLSLATDIEIALMNKEESSDTTDALDDLLRGIDFGG